MMGSGDMMARGMMARGAAGEHAMGPPMVFRVVFALAGIGAVLSYGGTLAAAGSDPAPTPSQPPP